MTEQTPQAEQYRKWTTAELRALPDDAVLVDRKGNRYERGWIDLNPWERTPRHFQHTEEQVNFPAHKLARRTLRRIA